MTISRWVRDNIIRAALAVFTLDWLFVGWKTYVWLDLAALLAIFWAGTGRRKFYDRYPDDFQ